MTPPLPASMNELSFEGANASSTEYGSYELVYASERTRIYRNNRLGVKTLIDPNLSIGECLELFQVEQKISSSLPPSCSQRKVLRVDTHQRNPGLFFEWVEGVTVGRWLNDESNNVVQQQMSGDFDDPVLATHLKVALAITKAVCDFHEAGMSHGNLTLGNIVLEFSGRSQNCSATLIDYTKSVIISGCPNNTLNDPDHKALIDSKIEKDLRDLGLVLYSILSNHMPNTNEETAEEEDSEDDVLEQQRNKRGKSEQGFSPAKRLPLYLMSLVSSLLNPTINQEGDSKFLYSSPRNMLADLQLAITKPGIYLKSHCWSDLVTKPLVIPNVFYGRRTELSMLRHSFDAMMEGASKPCVIVVSGYAGSGKTSFVRQVEKQLKQSNGYMIICKFNQIDPPDTILSSGLDLFFEKIIKCGNDDVTDHMQRCIKDELGDRVAVLEESMPHLRALLGRTPNVTGHGVAQALQLPHLLVQHNNREDEAYIEEQDREYNPNPKLRWKVQFSNLVHAISKQAHPIALVLEDLQWADEDSLDTIETVTMNKIRYCLFCVTYRDVDVQPRLTEIVQGLQNRAFFWSVKLGPIEKESADCLISEALCMPPTLIEPLSSIICSKTGGMILFITNVLKSLHEEQLIYFSLATLRWEFELEMIIHKEISTDIADFLSERITRLPGQIQADLKIASCLGSTFDLKVFQKANKSSDEVAKDFILFAKENGFLQELSPGQFVWSHDKLQEAAYSLIHTNKRESTHLLIGARIYLDTSSEELPLVIHDIVRNMNIGIAHLDSQDRKTELAQLNQVAGEQSRQSSAFYTAANYFLTGVGLLRDNWQNTDHYDLAMKLHNSAAEMLIVTGHITRLESIIEQPLIHARNLEDRLPAYHSSIRFLCLSGRFEEALNTCFSILNDLGEVFPDNVSDETIKAEIENTQMMLAGFPLSNLQSLPQMTNPMMHWMMKTMTTAILLLYSTNTKMASFLGCRMSQRSAEHGWCAYASFGLFTFGQSLIGATGNVDEGCAWSKAGISLLKEYKISDGRLPVVEALHCSFISFWKEPIQATSDSLIRSHKETLMEGQMEFAMSTAFHHCRHSFMSGTSLAKLDNDCFSVSTKMAELKQLWAFMFHAPLHCLVLKLMGRDDRPVFAAVSMVISDEDELLQRATTTGKHVLAQHIYFFRMMLAYWMKDYETAAQMSELYGKDYMRFMDIYHVFYEGLTALQLARRESHGRDRWISIAESAVSKFQSWEGHSNWNFENKHLLLSAELSSVKGHFSVAKEKYKSSIVSAQKHRFLHEEGLAMEQLGSLYKNQGDLKSSKDLLTKARACYMKWGATAVVERLDASM